MNVDVNRPTWAYCVLRHLHSFHDNRTMVTKDIIIMMIMMIISWWQSQQLWLGTLITMAMVIDENHDIDNDVATVMNKVFLHSSNILSFFVCLFCCNLRVSARMHHLTPPLTQLQQTNKTKQKTSYMQQSLMIKHYWTINYQIHLHQGAYIR